MKKIGLFKRLIEGEKKRKELLDFIQTTFEGDANALMNAKAEVLSGSIKDYNKADYVAKFNTVNKDFIFIKTKLQELRDNYLSPKNYDKLLKDPTVQKALNFKLNSYRNGLAPNTVVKAEKEETVTPDNDVAENIVIALENETETVENDIAPVTEVIEDEVVTSNEKTVASDYEEIKAQSTAKKLEAKQKQADLEAKQFNENKTLTYNFVKTYCEKLSQMFIEGVNQDVIKSYSFDERFNPLKLYEIERLFEQQNENAINAKNIQIVSKWATRCAKNLEIIDSDMKDAQAAKIASEKAAAEAAALKQAKREAEDRKLNTMAKHDVSTLLKVHAQRLVELNKYDQDVINFAKKTSSDNEEIALLNKIDNLKNSKINELTNKKKISKEIIDLGTIIKICENSYQNMQQIVKDYNLNIEYNANCHTFEQMINEDCAYLMKNSEDYDARREWAELVNVVDYKEYNKDNINELLNRARALKAKLMGISTTTTDVKPVTKKKSPKIYTIEDFEGNKIGTATPKTGKGSKGRLVMTENSESSVDKD